MFYSKIALIFLNKQKMCQTFRKGNAIISSIRSRANSNKWKISSWNELGRTLDANKEDFFDGNRSWVSHNILFIPLDI